MLGTQGVTLQNQEIINQGNVETIFSNPIDSNKEYFIDGIIDISGLGVNIEIPSGGMEIKGYSFDTSKIICSDNTYTLFTSPVGGSGNLLDTDVAYEITGTSSQVYNIFSLTGDEAIEHNRVNWNDCTSLGTIDNYRQGLESGSGRFGGMPELTLKGVWSGGYFIDTSIVRALSDGAYTLYKAGTGFSMASRFRSNQNIDLPASVSFLDFSPSNFPNPSTLQLDGCLISRNGAFNADDANMTPNITMGDLASSWSGNNGIPNTFEGGSIGVTTEAETVIATQGAFVPILATSWTSADLQHFENPSVGQLKNLGNNPREYRVIASFTCESTQNNQLVLKVKKWDDSASSFVSILEQLRQVNNLSGARDVAFFTININVTLDVNDYIELDIANNSSDNNVTAEQDSYFIVEER